MSQSLPNVIHIWSKLAFDPIFNAFKCPVAGHWAGVPAHTTPIYLPHCYAENI